MIVVTTPTGQIGHQVLQRVVDSGEDIRVIVRDRSKIPADWRSRVEIIEGSHGDADVIERALEGADSLFWLVPPDPKAASVDQAYVGFSEPAAAAIGKHGVERVVVVTALGRGTPYAETAGFVTGSLHMDDMLARTGANLMEVTNPSFMDNIARQIGALKEKGMFFDAIDGDRKAPTCATRDIAATSAALLLDWSWSGRGHRAVLGPEDLSFNEQAAIMSEVLGKPIRYQQISLDAYRTRFTDMGMSAAMAQGMADMARAKNDGLDNGEPRTPENSTPTSFRQWCEEELKPALAG